MSKPFPEYEDYDALGLAELVKSKEISPQELLDTAINRIETLNPRLQAVNKPLFDYAQNSLEQVNTAKPFAGVPILLKDIQHHLKGTPLSEGSKAYINNVSDHDAFVSAKLKDAGFIICGKTNTPEFALKGITEPDAFPPTKNPWDINYTPGGSSGGSSAAVAARMVPLASASDGGGSIRIPASYSGLVGLKPSRARVSSGPAYGDLWGGLSSALVLSRTVRDTSACLDLLSGPMPGDPYGLYQQEDNYLLKSKDKSKRLVIAVNTESPLGAKVDKEAIDAIEHTIKVLEDLGHRVEKAKPDIEGTLVADSFFMVYYAYMSARLNKAIELFGKKKAHQLLELDTKVFSTVGNAVNAGEYVAQRENWNTMARTMGQFFQTYDLYLTPTCAQLPFEVGEMSLGGFQKNAAKFIVKFDLGNLLIKTGMVKKTGYKALARTPFTQLANLTGLPAMSLPLYISGKGLPMGSQFIAPLGDELTLLQLANELEEADPWIDRKPTLIKDTASN